MAPLKKTICFTFLTVFITLCAVSNAAEQVYLDWDARYAGETDQARASDIAVDAQGNAYVGGMVMHPNGDWSFCLVKYDPSGHQQWVRFYDEPTGDIQEFTDVIVASDGNIYYSGHTYGYEGSSDTDWAVVSYTPDGELRWDHIHDGGLHMWDTPGELAEGPDRYIYVGGTTRGTSNSYDATLHKYAPNGTLIWSCSYNVLENLNEICYNIAIDSQGDIYLAGERKLTPDVTDYLLVKFSPAGDILWAQSYDGGGPFYDRANDVVVDSEDNVYMTGFISVGGNFYDYATTKWDVEGNLLWVRTYNNPYYQDDFAWAMTCDSDDNVIVTGYSSLEEPSVIFDFLTIKYSSDGTEEWVRRYNGPGYGTDRPNAIAADAEGNIYIGGESCSPEFIADYALIKYNPDGILLWEQVYNGTGDLHDDLMDLTVDAEGEIYTTGYSLNRDQCYDVYTRCFSQDPQVDIALEMTPVDTPVVIPSTGGSFDYDLVLTNSESSPVRLDVWARSMEPTGEYTGITIGPLSVVIPPGSVERTRTQWVSGYGPAGDWAYLVYVGDYPTDVYAMDWIEFEKLDWGDGEMVEEWRIEDHGDWADLCADDTTPVPQTTSVQINPNPFNPTTVASFELPVASDVTLAVYDVSGREVARLAEGWMEPGRHEVTFDGSDLASGIYFYRLTAGDFTGVGKMLLLK